jgi:hypothetical protein
MTNHTRVEIGKKPLLLLKENVRCGLIPMFRRMENENTRVEGPAELLQLFSQDHG